ncbi:hypothetical protein MCAP1_001999 [Malassezia caprae]|uniref:Uncharacterized protein n=1 Tax=Malassezia caprae TaxID=1381934 RepID=A0AAF0IWN3_9BASI|nr:hypothetical protein MCAP1_001999 [Malassezia caprae]
MSKTGHENEDDDSLAEIDLDNEEEDIDEVDEDDGLTLDNEVDDSLVVEHALDGNPASNADVKGLSNGDDVNEDESEDDSTDDSTSDSTDDSTSDSTGDSTGDSEADRSDGSRKGTYTT